MIEFEPGIQHHGVHRRVASPDRLEQVPGLGEAGGLQPPVAPGCVDLPPPVDRRGAGEAVLSRAGQGLRLQLDGHAGELHRRVGLERRQGGVQRGGVRRVRGRDQQDAQTGEAAGQGDVRPLQGGVGLGDGDAGRESEQDARPGGDETQGGVGGDVLGIDRRELQRRDVVGDRGAGRAGETAGAGDDAHGAAERRATGRAVGVVAGDGQGDAVAGARSERAGIEQPAVGDDAVGLGRGVRPVHGAAGRDRHRGGLEARSMDRDLDRGGGRWAGDLGSGGAGGRPRRAPRPPEGRDDDQQEHPGGGESSPAPGDGSPAHDLPGQAPRRPPAAAQAPAAAVAEDHSQEEREQHLVQQREQVVHPTTPQHTSADSARQRVMPQARDVARVRTATRLEPSTELMLDVHARNGTARPRTRTRGCAKAGTETWAHPSRSAARRPGGPRSLQRARCRRRPPHTWATSAPRFPTLSARRGRRGDVLCCAAGACAGGSERRDRRRGVRGWRPVPHCSGRCCAATAWPRG